MHQERENLDIIFRRTLPEVVLESIRECDYFYKRPTFFVDAKDYSQVAYRHFSVLNMPEYSLTEVEMRHESMRESVKESGVFELLYQYADKVLDMKQNEPLCRLEKSLNWNSISSRLGQDIFTTSWLAWKDIAELEEVAKNLRFTWPAVLRTDDKKLNEILAQGVAENHYHLYGSTQSFPVSWACLMNHPDYIHKFLKIGDGFKENLNYNVSQGILDNVMDWDARLIYAAMIRALLFKRCVNDCNSEDVCEEFTRFDRIPFASTVKDCVETLKLSYGVRFEQINGRKYCLDYANCNKLYLVDSEQNNRLLAGERSFLYHCFIKQLGGEFSDQESMLFYLYLLIKSQFRSELIQVNRRSGFKNFSNYQDRKNRFFEAFLEYWTESQRLAVCSSIEENHIKSLEARIMPNDSAENLCKAIAKQDRLVRFSHGELSGIWENEDKKEELPYYYVIHFAKRSFCKQEFEHENFRLLPRNWQVREKAKKGAKALSKYLSKYDLENQRVFGIDACSMEIGCRPETFATEFRYLRRGSQNNIKKKGYCGQEKGQTELGITFHVG